MIICRYQDPSRINEEPKIFNYVSSTVNPLTWERYIKEMHNNYDRAPPLQSMWYGFYVLHTNFWIGKILKFLLHRTPAMFIDFLLIISGKSPK